MIPKKTYTLNLTNPDFMLKSFNNINKFDCEGLILVNCKCKLNTNLIKKHYQ